MRTSFHHQPEAQHPKSPAIETPAGRLPHLLVGVTITYRATKCLQKKFITVYNFFGFGSKIVTTITY
jgi:hypothetical protein